MFGYWRKKKKKRGREKRNLKERKEGPVLFGHDLLAYGLRLRFSALSV